ncbi:DUF1127 domain-containing protein [Rhodobacterales bacterium]|nr:DUF1127 domain-containing protein [Rhodobacterales bacterium]
MASPFMIIYITNIRWIYVCHYVTLRMFHKQGLPNRRGTGCRNPFGRPQEIFAMTQTFSTPFFALFGQTVARAWRVYKNRRQFAELSHWTDEQLLDVGLTRHDVRRALSLPFYSDPSSLVSGSPAMRHTVTINAANTPQAKPALKVVKNTHDASGSIAA